MSNTVKALNENHLNYETLIKGRAYAILPKNLKYDCIKMALIVKNNDNFELLIVINEDLVKTLKFDHAFNIIHNYNYAYQYSIRYINNKLKTKDEDKLNDTADKK